MDENLGVRVQRLAKEISWQLREYDRDLNARLERRDTLSFDDVQIWSSWSSVWESTFQTYLPEADALARLGAPECWELLASSMQWVRASGQRTMRTSPVSGYPPNYPAQPGSNLSAAPKHLLPMARVTSAGTTGQSPSASGAPQQAQPDILAKIYAARQQEWADIAKDARAMFDLQQEHLARLSASRLAFNDRLRR
ncbi:hypothetical protein [uncultured Enterovirga sp.]|uniref:hypothetical protein n=1 Tax=uncultured Enterovirga sp. TaxID=2026352 RepID=UPI0035C97FCC